MLRKRELSIVGVTFSIVRRRRRRPQEQSALQQFC
jgi:hypothetical protein